MHDDADTVGNSLTNLLMMNGLVHNPPVGPEEASNEIDVRDGDGFILSVHLD